MTAAAAVAAAVVGVAAAVVGVVQRLPAVVRCHSELEIRPP